MPSMIFSHKLLVIRNYVLVICIKTDDLAKLKHFNIKTKKNVKFVFGMYIL